jgi:uncharacterized protein YbaP (TraB family)
VVLTSFRRKFRWAACTAAVALTACTASTAQEVPAAKPALWKLADEDTTIYLFGTIHALPKGVSWRTPALEQAIAASDSLVLEIVGANDPAKIAPLMMRLGQSEGLPPLLERVPADKRPALEKAVAATGVPTAALDKMETWLAALLIVGASFQKLGIDPSQGAEQSLEATYKAAGKPLDALETPEQQLGFFDTLSEEAQRLVLVSALDDPAAAKAQFEAMMKAWASGDVDAIARTFDDETTLSPELRDVLMKRRNANWVEWLDKRLDQPGTIMVAVGAGHLAGADSVQNMLAAKGMKVERVQ